MNAPTTAAAETSDYPEIREGAARLPGEYWRALEREERDPDLLLPHDVVVSTNLILAYLAEHVLGLPRSY